VKNQVTPLTLVREVLMEWQSLSKNYQQFMNLVVFLIAGVNESEFSFSSSENNPPSIIIYSSIDRMQRFIISGNSISSIYCSNQSVA